MKKSLLIIFSIIWALIIFNFSNESSNVSNRLSKNLIYELINITNSMHITSIYENEVNDIIDLLNTPIRKLAHMTEYFILALLVFNLLKNHQLKSKKYYCTLIICFFYALLDEYHQSFVSGRTSRFTDCLIDIFGSVVYLFLVYKISVKKKNSKKRRFRLYY